MASPFSTFHLSHHRRLFIHYYSTSRYYYSILIIMTDDNIICNDPNGLCLAASGNMDKKTSGVYTSLLNLASRLEPTEAAPKRIVIETSSATIHIKDYEGHAVAVKVEKAVAGAVPPSPSSSTTQ
jgi:hypothetical protein